MKIAHINNVAGVASKLAEAQRRLGHDATVFSLEESPYQFPFDVRLRGAEGPLAWNAVMAAHWRTFSDFDVLHVHGGIARSQVFYPLFKRWFPRKTLAVHYHGSEARTGAGLHHTRFADVRFHSTPDLVRWIQNSQWIPNPIDLPRTPPRPDNVIPRFGHFVSARLRKGTDLVIELFREVFGPVKRESTGRIAKFRGKGAELWVVTQVPHPDALEVMKGCDAVIDQMAPYGIYGLVAIEGMAFGKPVFGTPRLEWFPGCPVVPLTSSEGKESLRKAAADPEYRRELGGAGRVYVSHVHESGKVARRILKAYYVAQQLPPLSVEEAVSYWKRRGSSYAREIATSKAFPRYAAQASELLTVLEELRFDSVAEIGCGFGRIGRLVVDRFRAEWVGADLSGDQLLEARRRPGDLSGRLVQASADALPFADDRFDLVLSVEMLMHIPPERIASVLRELWRVAKRYVVHLDWFEDYLVGHETGWCWLHDYPASWRSLGAEPREIRVRATGVQSVFLVEKPSTSASIPPPAEAEAQSIDASRARRLQGGG